MSEMVPKVRFQGFTDDWEKHKVGDLFKVTRGQVLAANETSVSQSEIMPYPVYSSQTKQNGLMGYYKDYLFDTAITWTTDGANAGTVNYREGKFYSTNVNGVLLSSEGYANKLVAEIINREAWKWVSHVGNPKLMNNVMENIEVSVPSQLDEHIKISKFLTKIDNIINLHQRKIDLLKEQKKGFLQKMFPKDGQLVPEVRFAGFTDDWEQRKLGELASNFEYGLNASAKEFDGIHKYIRITDIDDSSRKFNSDSITSPDIDLSSADNYKLKNGDLLFARTGASVGKSYLYTESDGLVYYAGFLIRARLKSEFDSNFVFQNTLTNDYNNFIKVTSQRSGQPGVNAQEYASFNIKTPCYDEQQKIGLFFKQLDDLITLHQRKVDFLKEQKKGYLQKMFVS